MNDDEHGGRTAGVHVFAGLRSEPFFLDLRATVEMMNTGRLAFTEPRSPFGVGWNVLSIVAEVYCAPLLAAGGGPLFATAAETVIAGRIPVRLERVGRPEIKNVILSPRSASSRDAARSERSARFPPLRSAHDDDVVARP